jgi:hyperosmotically inducible periplasmic protein
MRPWVSLLMAGVLLMAPALAWGSTADRPLDERVRRELNTLPFFSVFDYLNYRVDGDKVILTGEVTRPGLKHDAETVVSRTAGVAAVDNQIVVLPLSGFDDRIRLAELRAIYGNSVLQRYGLGAYAPIRIVVKDGNVTLEGFVSSQMDKNVAGLAANSVPGVFSVTNNLAIDAS